MLIYPRRIKLFGQAAIVSTIILALISGLTFALLKSQTGAVQSNVIKTASASLQVSKDGANYSQTIEGFTFDNIVPGYDPMPINGHQVYVKNVGSTPLSVTLSANTDIENINNVDLSKVHIIVTPVGGGAVQNLTLQQLIQAGTNNIGIALNQASRLVPGQLYAQKFQVSMEADAVAASEATLSNIVFKFDAVTVQ